MDNNDITIDGRTLLRYKMESGRHFKSIPCYMVLVLMDTDEYSENYCDSLRLVLTLFPDVDRSELEKEIGKYI